jgi:TonB-dependent SusC/RagA subfamily outer membrane receptor
MDVADLIAITGTVLDENGEPMPGATVTIEGSTSGTVTDVDGNFSIDVDEGAVLVVSFIGYKTKRIPVSNQNELTISMELDASSLEEVVVVGYGTQIQSRLTGSIERANAEDMARISVPTVTQALQGRAAGVFIKNQNGQPGENKTAINIRGFGTPLYIVDGLPVAENVFANLNPNDIESLNILKDAAAAAVYGARAGNGVVLVTTKRGKAGRAEFNYRGDVGLQGLTTLPNTTDSWEYMALYNIRNRLDRGLAVLPFLEKQLKLSGRIRV